MLAFVTCGAHQYTVRDVLETRSSAFQGCVMVLSYRDFLSFESLPVADYILVDLERIDDRVIGAAAKRVEDLRRAVPGLKVLNTPEVGLRRLAVSQRLVAAGINEFRVAPIAAIPADLRFPVFVRRLDDHDGPLTGMLASREEMDAAIARLRKNDASDADLAVTEFVDTRDAEGRHRKLSYFRVGERYFPGAMNWSADWVCKGVAGEAETDVMRAERMTFLTGNPHEAIMRPVFEAAGLSYGRADYAMIDGRPQVFEINTNPMIVPPTRVSTDKRVFVETILANWFAAIGDYSSPSLSETPRWVNVPKADVPPPPSSGPIGRRILHRVLTATNQLHRETAFMRPFRTLRREAAALRSLRALRAVL